MAVLLADEIKKLCVDETGSSVEEPLIQPFCPRRLRAASYQLTLGDEVHIGGSKKLLSHHPNGVVLKPHQVAVVSTRETLRIPRDLIARWSLRVTNIYEGLLWTGGLQVDPGWEGPLFCPIYNLAERPVVLRHKMAFFAMDFVRTTPLGVEYENLRRDEQYPGVWFEPQRWTLEQHDTHHLRSAPYEALRQLRELRHFRNVGYIAVTLIMLVLTFMVAALAIVAIRPTVELGGPLLSFWPMTALVGAGVAVVLSLASIGVGALVWWRFRNLL